MAPQTTQEVLSNGDYLEKNFDPNSLRKDVLLGILVHHGVPYPSQHKKDTLVTLFNEEIKPRAAELKHALQRAKRQEASSEGVIDGVTGRNVAGVAPRRRTAPPTRAPAEASSSRRKSETPSGSTRTSTRRSAVKQEEDTEQEIEEEAPPAQATSARRRTPTQSANPSKPRKSRKEATPIEEEPAQEPEQEEEAGNTSAWENNNPFQSGPSDKESSPGRPSARRAAAKTLVKKATRQSASSSPAPATADPPVRRSTRHQNEFQTPLARVKSASDWKAQGEEVRQMEPTDGDSDEDDIPRSSMQPGDELVPLNDTPDYRSYKKRRSSAGILAEDEAEEDDDQDAAAGDVARVQKNNDYLETRLTKLANGSPSALRRRTNYANAPVAKAGRSWWKLFFLVLLGMASGTAFFSYKADSAYIGFCDAGTNSNLRMLELQHARKLRREAASTCVTRITSNSSWTGEFCTPFPLHSFFDATTCTPCPERAVCTPDSVVCNPNFVLKEHGAARIPFVVNAMNGFPGIGPVAFPPQCVKDQETLQKIGGLVTNMEGWLARKRGEQICKNVPIAAEAQGGEAKSYGFELESVREAAVNKRKADPKADEIFERALAKLEESGWIIRSTDSEGFHYVAGTRAEYSVVCRMQVAFRDFWKANQYRLYGFIAVMFGLLYARQRIRYAAIEKAHVAELVQETLDLIQERDEAMRAEQADPVIVPTQLRDDILRHELSPAVRQRVWQKVEQVVEGNANVRTNMHDINGEDMRVWRWVGTGTPSRSRSRSRSRNGSRRVSWAEKTASGSLLKDHDDDD